MRDGSRRRHDLMTMRGLGGSKRRCRRRAGTITRHHRTRKPSPPSFDRGGDISRYQILLYARRGHRAKRNRPLNASSRRMWPVNSKRQQDPAPCSFHNTASGRIVGTNPAIFLNEFRSLVRLSTYACGRRRRLPRFRGGRTTIMAPRGTQTVVDHGQQYTP